MKTYHLTIVRKCTTTEVHTRSYKKVCNVLKGIADDITAVSGSNYISSDLDIDLLTIKNRDYIHAWYPTGYELWFRLQGVEGGEADICKERCNRLGNPIIIVNIRVK